jgi:hypothetical protein
MKNLKYWISSCAWLSDSPASHPMEESAAEKLLRWLPTVYPAAGYRAIPVDAPARAACNPSPCDHVLERLGSSRGYITSVCGMRRAHTPAIGAWGYCASTHARRSNAQSARAAHILCAYRASTPRPANLQLTAGSHAGYNAEQQQMLLPRCHTVAPQTLASSPQRVPQLPLYILNSPLRNSP